MARREPIKITLGDQSFAIRPLTIGQMERIEAVVLPAAGSDRVGGSIPTATKVVAIALDRDHGSVNVREIECEPREIADAFHAVLRHGGFVQGEAPAAAGGTQASESTGPGSAADSPRDSV